MSGATAIGNRSVLLRSSSYLFRFIISPSNCLNILSQVLCRGRIFPNGGGYVNILPFNSGINAFGFEIKSNGIAVSRISYLFILSFAFLVLIFINGYFKYVINMRKGALGERLLQRLRFDLFSSPAALDAGGGGSVSSRPRPPPSSRTRSSRSAASSATPSSSRSFLGGQAMTALVFILVQNRPLGLIAGGMILVQVLIIPRLRREQFRLGQAAPDRLARPGRQDRRGGRDAWPRSRITAPPPWSAARSRSGSRRCSAFATGSTGANSRSSC